jgi:RNA polymerase sigma-70 factor (ECF subfamily)
MAAEGIFQAEAALIGESSTQLALRDPDIRLMLRVRDDDAEAFAELVELYHHRLVTVMHHLVNSAEEAEDLAQEVFLRVYRGRKKYHPKAKFSTWLYTIANNLALNVLRTRQRKPTIPLNVRDSGPLGPRPAEQMVLDRGDQPHQSAQKQELAAIVQQALETLNERQRIAVVLNKFEDMNYAEIAEVMGLTTKAVKSLLSRARDNLRVALQGYINMDQARTDESEPD